MSRLFIGFLLLLFMVSCGRKKMPEGVVQEKQMVPLLYDFHLAEGYISSLPMDSSRLMARNFYHAVFEKYGTDSAGFQRSLVYYAKDPEVLNRIYEAVQERLKDLQQNEQAKLDEKNRKTFIADSIRAAAVRDSTFRLQLDSLQFRLGKGLILGGKRTDSTGLAAKPWSLPLYEALVGHALFVKGKVEEANKLLTDSTAQTKKETPKDTLGTMPLKKSVMGNKGGVLRKNKQ